MNIENARKLVASVFKNENLSIGLVGGSGLGKTTIAKKIAEDLGLKFCYMPIRSDDAMGLNLPKSGQLDFIPHKRLKMTLDEPFLIYVDEVNRADRLARQAVMELVGERSVGGESLHKKSVVLLSMNDEHDDYDVCALDEALKTRFIPIPITFDSALSVSYAKENGFHRMAAFLNKHPEELNRDLSWRVRPDPRFLELMDRFYRASGESELAAQVVSFCLDDKASSFLSPKLDIIEEISNPFAHKASDLCK